MRDPSWRRYRRFWGPDVRSDIDDELAFHVELRVEELVANGMDPAAARREALRRLGDAEALARACGSIGAERLTTARRREWLEGAWTELRVAARALLRYPVVTGVAILTLALGLGATTAIFDVLYTVMLRPLPYADAGRMVRIAETVRGNERSVGPGQFTEWTARARTVESIGAYLPTTFNLTDGTPERVRAAFATADLFRARYLTPALGRYFDADEEQPGRDQVVVLSHALFQQRFGGDRGVIGRSIRLNDRPYTIIGVAPAEFSLATPDDMLWTPLALTAEQKATFTGNWLLVYAKRRPGVSLAEAQHDLERVSREIAALHPGPMVDRSARVVDFHGDLAAKYERNLTVLFGAVGFVLLLACLNVANLLLARATVRRKETAIRVALGATRGHIVRHFLMESLVLAGAGAALGFVVSRLTLGVLLRLAPGDVPGLEHAGEGSSAAVFLVVVSLCVAVCLGLLPALRSVRRIEPALRTGGRSSSVTTTRDRVRSALVVCEVALAFVLLAGAGLFVRSARRLGDIDPGFDPGRLVTARVSLASPRYPTDAHVQRGYLELVERVRGLPHVASASATSAPPLAGGGVSVALSVEGRVYAPGAAPSAQFHTVVPGYFETVRTPLVSGRALEPSDRADAPPVVVISETLARLLWPNERALGKRVACCEPDSARVWREVVGVVGDARQLLARDPVPAIFVPIEQVPAASWVWHASSLAFVVRTDGNVANVMRGIRGAVAASDPELPVYDVWTYDEVVQRGTAANRFSTMLFSALAALASILAAVGIYGVLAFSVAQRSFEMSVRLAFGARPGQVLAVVARHGMALVVTGLAIGLALAIAVSRVVVSLLYEIRPTDPLTYVVAMGLLGVVGLLASCVPARRAAAADPAATLRA